MSAGAVMAGDVKSGGKLDRPGIMIFSVQPVLPVGQIQQGLAHGQETIAFIAAGMRIIGSRSTLHGPTPQAG